ncbi:hypothetical protein HYZ99_02910 [Candidatus Peregrinibacteria bacterium]|nr:hypothetical protein [Candidatus Peregrinibacteria bacterium]
MKRVQPFLISFSLLLLACSRTTVGVDSESIGEQVVPQVIPGPGPVEVPGHGQELWFAVGAMTGAPGVNANGVAQAHYLEDGTGIVTVQLNIERAPEGSFFEAWLVSPSGRISLGHLRTPFGDVRHSLKYLEKQDVRSYGKLEVTRELDDGNAAPGVVVAEAMLKERNR